MESADGRWKREREREKTSTSVSPEGKEKEGLLGEGGESDARKTQLNLNAAEKSRRQWEENGECGSMCFHSNCEMARKQESPKEINRPRPDYLWLVGIKSQGAIHK